ncbi:hypothetical protein LOZ36_004259 [Ophidiomyces ophidiicola]|nr:hypothetical protein LOZ36_004259 [Ophidiomyces ophidiicola]
MRFSSRILFSLLYYIYVSPLAFGAGIQYCRNDPPLCFAVASMKNNTAGGHDIHLSLVMTPSINGGWAAVGIGNKMSGSLMFLVYSEKGQKALMTSIRTVESHDNPTLLMDHGRHVEMINSSISSTSYHARFVCYSCDHWWRTATSKEGKTQFIYAANRKQTFDTATSNSVLKIHDTYGVVEGDMDKALLSDPHEPLPAIRPGETSGFELKNENGVIKSTPKSSTQQSPWLSPGQVHGIVMVFVFMGLFMPGGIIIRLPLVRAFRYHWAIQACASLLALGSAAYMAVRSTHFDLHKILGLTVVGSLPLQAMVGYKHHAIFMRIHRQSVYTSVHKWAGRALLLLGSLNVGFGLSHSRRSTGAILAWFIIWLVEIVGIVWILRRKRQERQQQRGQLVPKDEPENGLISSQEFEIGDSDSSDSEDGL